jgi:hypothetical protein
VRIEAGLSDLKEEDEVAEEEQLEVHKMGCGTDNPKPGVYGFAGPCVRAQPSATTAGFDGGE